MKEFKINIVDHINSNIIFGRSTGNKIKQKFNEYYLMGIKIDLDFKGVNSVTHSFVDELIGTYIYYDSNKALEKIKFSNCNDEIKSMIKFVINDRLRNSQELK